MKHLPPPPTLCRKIEYAYPVGTARFRLVSSRYNSTGKYPPSKRNIARIFPASGIKLTEVSPTSCPRSFVDLIIGILCYC